MRWLYFFGLYFLQLAVSFPSFSASCHGAHDPAAVAIWLLHHWTDVFLFWGFLFATSRGEYMLHLLFLVIALAHWSTYKNRCIATVVLNRYCGWPEDQWLDSLLNRSGLRSRSDYWQFLWLGLLACNDVVHLV